MHVQHLATTATLLALTPVVIIAQNTTTSLDIPLNFNCSTFSGPDRGQAIRNYTAPYNQTLRVSRAVTCPDNASSTDSNCVLNARGSVNVTATSNATDIPDAQLLHATLLQALRLSGASNTLLNNFETAVWKRAFNSSNNRFQVAPGSAGYIGFTPNMTCYDGVVNTPDSCSTSDEGIKNVKERFENRPLQVCVPILDKRRSGKGSSTRVAGTVELVTISKEEAGKEEMSRNPADSYTATNDAPRPAPSNWQPGDGVGGSGNVEMQWMSLCFGLLMAIWMVGVM